MDIWEMRKAIGQARRTMNDADKAAREIAPLLPGRLRHCDGATLVKIKKELRDFNCQTWRWKE